jgi:hypothetical protein
MNLPNQPLSGSIAAAGVANAVTYTLTAPDSSLLLEISGAYVGASLVFEAQPRGSSTWAPVAGTGVLLGDAASALASGTAALPFPVVPDGATLAFRFDLSQAQAFRVWAQALASGPVAVNIAAGSPYRQAGGW